MAEVVPINGIHYDPARVGRLEEVIGPPYDVLSPADQDALYAASPFNFVRIMLNRSEPGDDPDAPYTRAARYLDDWLEQGILQVDSAPAYYVYRQEFTNPVDGGRRTRTGLFCGLRLEPYASGVVLPHEETRLKAKEDRLKLMRATRANPEPIFCSYEDREGMLQRALDRSLSGIQSVLTSTIEGDTHQVWRLDDPDGISSIQRFFADRRIWIMDGHHRYETGLAYAAERRQVELPAAPQPYDYLLVVMTAFEDPGIVVLPTHRLIKNVSSARMEQLFLQVERYFDIEKVSEDQLAEKMAGDPSRGEHRFGMATPAGAWVLSLRDFSLMDAAVEDHTHVWKELDVSILHTLILDRSLGIPIASLSTTSDVGYTRSWDEALSSVKNGDYQIAFLLNQPSADEVRRVAGAGDKMPPKSTFFYPKLWSGLLLRRI